MMTTDSVGHIGTDSSKSDAWEDIGTIRQPQTTRIDIDRMRQSAAIDAMSSAFAGLKPFIRVMSLWTADVARQLRISVKLLSADYSKSSRRPAAHLSRPVGNGGRLAGHRSGRWRRPRR